MIAVAAIVPWLSMVVVRPNDPDHFGSKNFCHAVTLAVGIELGSSIVLDLPSLVGLNLRQPRHRSSRSRTAHRAAMSRRAFFRLVAVWGVTLMIVLGISLWLRWRVSDR